MLHPGFCSLFKSVSVLILCTMSWILFFEVWSFFVLCPGFHSLSKSLIKYGDFMCYDLGSLVKSVSVMVLCAMTWVLC